MRVASATIVSVQAHTEDGLNNTYLFFLAPEGTEDVSFTLVANAPCASGRMIRAVRSPCSVVSVHGFCYGLRRLLRNPFCCSIRISARVRSNQCK